MNALWQSMCNAGLVSGSPPEHPFSITPWYVRLMLGVAGWIAALFILGFVASGMAWIVESDAARTVAGLIIVAVAWLMLHTLRANEFVQQFGLAVSFAGQTLFVFGLFGFFDHRMAQTAPWLMLALLQAALTVLMPNTVHRHWSAFAASVAFFLSLQATSFAFLTPAVLLGAAVFVWIREFNWPSQAQIVRAAGYGMVIALITADLSGGLFRQAAEIGPGTDTERLVGQLCIGAVLLGLVWTLLRSSRVDLRSRTAAVVMAGTVMLVLVSLEAPGITTGVCILLLGFAHGNTVLTGLGIAGLLLFAGSYYYQMDVTLLVKSQVLAMSGAIMLLLRWLIQILLKTSLETDDEDA